MITVIAFKMLNNGGLDSVCDRSRCDLWARSSNDHISRLWLTINSINKCFLAE
jgi:hypothetical protein